VWLGVCGGLGLGWRGEQKPAPRRQHGEGVSAQGELLRNGAGGRQRLRVRATGVGWAAAGMWIWRLRGRVAGGMCPREPRRWAAARGLSRGGHGMGCRGGVAVDLWPAGRCGGGRVVRMLPGEKGHVGVVSGVG